MVDGHRSVADNGAGETDDAGVCGVHCGALFDEKVDPPMTRIATDRRKACIDRPREGRCQTDTGVNQHGDGEHDGQGDPFLLAAAAPPYRQPGAV